MKVLTRWRKGAWQRAGGLEHVNTAGRLKKGAWAGDCKRVWVGCLVAVAAVALATGLRLLLTPALGETMPLVTYPLAMMLGAYVGGLVPGLLATLLSVAAGAYLLLEPTERFWAAQRAHQVGLGMLALVGTLISLLAEALHRARQRSEEQARQARGLQERITQMLQSITDCYLALNAQGRIEQINDRAAACFGRRRPEVLGRALEEMVPGLAGSIYQEEFARAVQSQAAAHFEAESPVAPGCWVEVHAYPQDHRLEVYFRDITQRKQGEAQFRLLADKAPAMLWMAGPDGGCTLLGQSWLELTGRSVEELRGFGWTREVHPDDLPRVLQTYEKAVETRANMVIEYRVRGRDGQYHWILNRGVPLFDAGGAFTGYIGSGTDITSLKRLEEALRDSERKFRTLAESAQAMIGIIQGAHFLYVNPYLVAQSGYTHEEVLKMDVGELVHPGFRALVMERARRRLMGEDMPSHYEYVMLTKQGQERWVELSVARMEYRGQPALIGIGYDITERKRYEQELRESEQRFRTLAEHIDLVIWIMDARREKVLYVSPAYKDIWGQAPETLYENPMGWIEAIHPEDQERVVKAFATALRGGERYMEEYRIIRPDGSVRWVRDRGYPVLDADGRLRQLVGTAEDITARRVARDAEREARREAERANQAKDRFLAALSHELRTPLTPVLATVSLLETDQRLDPDLRQDMKLIRRNAELEARLIDDLLDLTRIARGKLELHPQKVDVHKLLDYATHVCCQSEIFGKQIRLRIEKAATVYHVWGDPVRLQQLFWNLVSNAVKFTPTGGRVEIRTWNGPGKRGEGENGGTEEWEMGREGEGERGRNGDKGTRGQGDKEAELASPQIQNQESEIENPSIFVEVSDSGIGIEPEVIDRIFDAFEQANRAVTRHFGGLGMGLAICKAVVEQHGGEIRALSPGIGKGARFVVKLPALVEAEAEEALGPAASEAPAEGEHRQVRRRKILLVEDHPDTARTMKHLLEHMGHEVAWAGSISAALDLAARTDFDLVISDLGLPDGHGVDLMRALRQKQQTIRGIALSGYGMEEDISKSLEAGFSDHLTKPVSVEQLERVVGE